MQYKHIQVGSYNIHVFDDVFTLHEREKFYSYFSSSAFKLGWGDSVELHEQGKKYLHSKYTAEDIQKSNFISVLDQKNNLDLNKLLTGMAVTGAVVNLSTPAYSYVSHGHNQKLSMLYYANLRWQEDWAGETMFFSEDLKDVLFTSPYTPGRIIIFDNPLPHSMRAQSMSGPQYRFTFAAFLDSV